MNVLEHWAHEIRIALQDAGMVYDQVTGNSDSWKQDVEDVIKTYLQLALDDAKESETGR
jgi:hypothetical protein